MEATPKKCRKILPTRDSQLLVKFEISKEVQIRLVKLKVCIYKRVNRQESEKVKAIKQESNHNQAGSIQLPAQNRPHPNKVTMRTTHRGEKSHICQFCKNGFRKNFEKNAHEKRCRKNPKRDDAQWLDENKRHKCHLCNYASWNSADLRVHLRRHLEQKPFQCNLCTYKSSSKSDLFCHIATHTREKRFKCLQCDYSTVRMSDLRSHMKRRHGNKIEMKTFLCSLCARSFHSKSELYTHILKHTGETPFVCQFCKKGFNLIGSKNRHEKICKHNPKQNDKSWIEDQKVFKCVSCPYSSVFKSNLNTHLRIHTGKKPFHCSQCSYISAHSSTLKMHCTKRHAKG